MLTAPQLALIKASIPALTSDGEAITRRFYGILFDRNPELQNLFNMAHQGKVEQTAQAKALAQAVLAYAQNIDSPENLTAAVSRIANKHASLNIKPEQYDLVGAALLEALCQHLDIAADDPLIQAWGAAYGVLAKIFIDQEESLYQQNEAKAGGWRGWRSFELCRVARESEDVRSFYLRPTDGGDVAPYEGGQYISVKLDIPGHPRTEIRQYSLSEVPACAVNGGYYRITVKQDGLFSSYLHEKLKVGDKLDLSAPAGDFTLAKNDGAPTVFLSAGVGLTPLLSMLGQRTDCGEETAEDHFIHFDQNFDRHPFNGAIGETCFRHNINYITVYEADSSGDKQGRISKELIAQLSLPQNASFYICGPNGFMSAANQILRANGIDEANIYTETFGPTVALAS